MLKATATVENKYGLHARAAVTIVNEASKFSSEIFFTKGDDRINAKSILGVMVLEAVRGTKIDIEVTGDDETLALSAILGLFKDKFNEE
jgi:phosphocarrier protein